MNQEQRKFLITKITETCRTQVKELESSIPEEPLLNNYIIGAFLDNSVKIYDSKTIKANLKSLVESLGKDDFVDDRDGRWNGSRYVKTGPTISINPFLIMEEPKNFKTAFDKWKAIESEIRAKITALESQKDTLILKIQIGSNAILDKLITQVDSLGDLNLFGEQLSLIAGNIEPNQKQLGDSSNSKKKK